MNDKIAQLNLVIAELNLVTAILATLGPNDRLPPVVGTTLDQAKTDLAKAARSIIGQNPINGDA